MKLVDDMNPRSKPIKSMEMTVRRALAIIKVFDNLPPEAKDWTDAEPKDLRNAMGDKSFDPRQAVFVELWKRYKEGRLHAEVKAMADALPWDKLSKKARKEIESGLKRIGYKIG